MSRKYTGVLPLDHRGVESIINAPVDVLSILRDAQNVLRRDHYKAIPDDLHQVCAAVAELIEASESLEKYPDDLEIQAQFVRALSRVKGA